MTPLVVSTIFFVCTFGAALAGLKLRSLLPDDHLNDESRDTVKIGVGLVATMSALVLGLVTASAKSSFDAQDTAIKHLSADVMSLDRVLAQYGEGAAPAREALKAAVARALTKIWSKAANLDVQPDSSSANPGIEQVAQRIHGLAPQTDEQRWLQSRALDIGESVAEARWLVFTSLGSSVPWPFLTVLLFWLATTFVSFGLFGPPNATVVVTLFVCALSVAGAVFLVLEMDQPFGGLIAVSATPLEFAFERINQ